MKIHVQSDIISCLIKTKLNNSGSVEFEKRLIKIEVFSNHKSYNYKFVMTHVFTLKFPHG